MFRIIINNYNKIGKIPENLIYFLKKTKKQTDLENFYPKLFINLNNKVLNQSGGRFLYLFCSYLNKSNYNIIIKLNFKYFLFLHPYKKMLLNENFIYVRRMNTTVNSLIVQTKEKKKSINIALGQETLNKPYSYFLPFPMHPVQVDAFDTATLKTLRETQRKIKIFFSGSWTQSQYKNPLINFDVLPRYEVISSIIDKFNYDDLLKIIQEPKELYELIQLDNFKQKIIISEIKTADEDWLKFLSLSVFFISPPGFKYPWCHNSIEAMSVGSIPIIQYNKLFVPHLIHMENCIIYNNKHELEDAVNIALNMTNEEITIMRNNVISYFNNHLSPKVISERLEKLIVTEEEQFTIAIPYIN